MNNSLKALAEKYETAEFLVGDPSWFMHQIEGDLNKELLAFIASSLSYGSRKQFLPKIQSILDDILQYGSVHIGSADMLSLPQTNIPPHGSVHIGSADMLLHDWLTEGRYNAIIPPTPSCFYRLYTCKTFNDFLAALAAMVREYGSIKGYLKAKMQTRDAIEAISLITEWFREHDSVGVIPKDTTSSCKRVCMFLRWMVRTDSPVDLGLWSDIIDRSTLIIPMDTHVVQEAMRLGLLTSKSTSMSNALRLSQRLAEIFPGDPIKGDFALFGLGVDEDRGNLNP